MTDHAKLIAELRLFHHDEAADLFEATLLASKRLADHAHEVAENAVRNYVMKQQTPRIHVTYHTLPFAPTIQHATTPPIPHKCEWSHMYKYPDGAWCCLVCGKPKFQ